MKYGIWKSPSIYALIKFIPHSCFGLPDTICWDNSQDGNFSTKATYESILGEEHPDCDLLGKYWSWIWKANSSHRVKSFLWLVRKDRLPTESLLHRRKVKIDLICYYCLTHEESLEPVLR